MSEMKENIIETNEKEKFDIYNILKWLLLFIPLGYVIIVLGFSMVSLFKMSIFEDGSFTLKYIIQVLTEKVYLRVLFKTFEIAFLVTFICILMGYPVAYLAVNAKSKTVRRLINTAVLIPFMISMLVRNFSWSIVLQNKGIVNQLLMHLKIIDEPIQMLYNTNGVLVGMVHVLLPYMVISLTSIMNGIDRNLLLASQNMGAKPSKGFFSVYLPLSMSGILSGGLIVFLLSLGFFITPSLLGGVKDMMISSLIEMNINTTLNWNLAAALAVVLFIITIIMIVVIGALIIFKGRNKDDIKGVI